MTVAVLVGVKVGVPVGVTVGLTVGDPVGVTVGDPVGEGLGVGVGVGGGGRSAPIQPPRSGRPARVHVRVAPYNARTPCRFIGLSLFQSGGQG